MNNKLDEIVKYLNSIAIIPSSTILGSMNSMCIEFSIEQLLVRVVVDRNEIALEVNRLDRSLGWFDVPLILQCLEIVCTYSDFIEQVVTIQEEIKIISTFIYNSDSKNVLEKAGMQRFLERRKNGVIK